MELQKKQRIYPFKPFDSKYPEFIDHLTYSHMNVYMQQLILISGLKLINIQKVI